MKLVIKSVILSILLTLSIYAQPVNQYVIKRNGTAVIDTLYTTKHITDTAVVSDIQINGSLRANDFQIKNRLTEAVKFSIDTNGTVSGNNLIILGNATLGGSMATINDNPGGSMYGYSLNGKNLSGANYIGSIFNDESDPPAGMNLMSVDMSRSLAMGAVFKNCSFDENSSIQSMNATGANFDSVDFGNCDMEYLIATNSKLTNSILSTKITGMNVIGADLTGATVPYTLSEFQSITVWDKTTKWTDGNFMQGTVLRADTIIGAVGQFDEVDAEEVVENDTSLADKYLSKNGGTVNGNIIVNGNVQADNIIGTVVGDMEWSGIPAAYIMDGADDYLTSAFTQSTQAVEMLVYPTVTNKALCTFGTNMGITFNSSNVIQYGSSFANVTTYVNGAVGTTLTLNKWNHIIAVFDAITPTVLEVGRSGSTYFTGRVWGFRPYNRQLTAAEAVARWDNGAPHLYRLEYVDRGANNTNLTAGYNFTSGWTAVSSTINNATTFTTVGVGSIYRSFLTAGKRYRLTATITNSSSLLIRHTGSSVYATIPIGTSVAVVVEFVAGQTILQFQNEAAGTTVIENLTVTPIGCTAEYLPENAGAMGWIETQNALHGSTSGTPIAPQAERDYRSLISTTPVELTRSQKAQTILTRIVATNNDGSNARTISIGTTSGGTELVNAQSIGAGATIVISVGAYSATERSIYAVASGASVNIQMIYEKVAQ